ncbi:MAG: aspartate/ornithine carbamoyltransferase family protein [Rhabdaerophilum sp.]
MAPNHPVGKDLLSASDLSQGDIQDVIERGLRIMKAEGRSSNITNSQKIVANMFFQRSTRTKLGFEAAALRLGHRTIDAYDPERNRAGSANGDSFSDHIRTIAQFSDLIVFRHSDEEQCYEVSRLSPVPVINGGNGTAEHPTQALIDLFCMVVMKGNVNSQSLVISCDSRARYAYSLVLLLKHMPPKRLTFCVDPTLEFAPKTMAALADLEKKGTKIAISHDLEECLDHDILNIQTQDLTSKVKSVLGDADLPSYGEKERFVITAEKILKAKSDIIILNPLPRQGELDVSCDALPNARYFEQVKLSNFVRMAVLERMLAGIPWSGAARNYYSGAA